MVTEKKTRARRSIEDRITEIQQKLKALESRKQAQQAKKQKVVKVKLTKETAGMSDLLAWIDQIANENNVKPADVIIAAAKMKRTGLKLTK